MCQIDKHCVHCVIKVVLYWSNRLLTPFTHFLHSISSTSSFFGHPLSSIASVIFVPALLDSFLRVACATRYGECFPANNKTGCDCGTKPCGFYVFNHSSTAVINGQSFQQWFLDTCVSLPSLSLTRLFSLAATIRYSRPLACIGVLNGLRLHQLFLDTCACTYAYMRVYLLECASLCRYD